VLEEKKNEREYGVNSWTQSRNLAGLDEGVFPGGARGGSETTGEKKNVAPGGLSSANDSGGQQEPGGGRVGKALRKGRNTQGSF